MTSNWPISIEYFGHAAYTIGILSFMLKDMLWLRVVTIVAASMCVFYNYAAPIEPMWVPIYWNTALAGINVIQVALLLNEKREIVLEEKEQELYDQVFSNFTIPDFKRLMQTAEVKSSAPGETLIIEGQAESDLILITDGKCQVKLPHGAIAEILNGDFAGEMSYLSGKPTSATVSAVNEVSYLAWDRNKLDRLCKKSPTIQTAVKSALSNQLTDKIVRTSKLLTV